MKLYAPKYYKDFVCIADKCKHSCCINWEIDVDENALKKYSDLKGEYKDAIKNSISLEPSPHFILQKNERCPHLNEKGLCNIILNCGEDYLCDICREHPRFYNYTQQGKEVGIGISCEEAARIVLSSDNYQQLVEIGTTEEETDVLEFDAVKARTELYNVLSDGSIPYTERLSIICKKYGTDPSINGDERWKTLLSELEYLEKDHIDLFADYSSDKSTPDALEKYAERILAYFVFRHTSEAYNVEDFGVSLGFCMFCERLFVSACKTKKATELDEIIDIARIISEEIEYSEDNTDIIKNEFLF